MESLLKDFDVEPKNRWRSRHHHRQEPPPTLPHEQEPTSPSVPMPRSSTRTSRSLPGFRFIANIKGTECKEAFKSDFSDAVLSILMPAIFRILPAKSSPTNIYQLIVLGIGRLLGLSGSNASSILNSVISNTFVFCQVFNEISSRDIEKINVLRGIFSSWMFFGCNDLPGCLPGNDSGVPRRLREHSSFQLATMGPVHSDRLGEPSGRRYSQVHPPGGKKKRHIQRKPQRIRAATFRARAGLKWG
ncbi:hypothetical protein MLD38_015929 [Melastoma candidum]|uniref:Uncharacterized protein n=1 Tax=Melastoma candidum TaxID=119954 RepID=A0ACB9RH09_9MYRT|nr:hypothetical protein MLD38_015929 [Melastoma candidum]